jgi:hypothetical protein
MLMDNPHYAASARAIRELHHLIRAGQGDSVEADLIRDESDEHWRYLSLEEIDSLQNLSADLYSIDEPHRSGTTFGVEDSEDFQRAMASGDLVAVTRVLRRPGVKVDSKIGASLRAGYWTTFGDYESALLFYEECIRLSPGDPEARITRLVILWQIDEGRAFEEAVVLITDPRVLDPDDRIEVGTVLALTAYCRAKSRGGVPGGFGQEERQALEQVVRTIEISLASSPDGLGRPSLELEDLALEILDFCRSVLGELRSSFRRESGDDRIETEQTERLDELAGRFTQKYKQVFVHRSMEFAA